MTPEEKLTKTLRQLEIKAIFNPALRKLIGFDLTFTCQICHARRVKCRVSVIERDISSQYNMPADTFVRNIRYCNDNDSCKAAAISFIEE